MPDEIPATEATFRSFSNDYNAATIQNQLIHEEHNSGDNIYPLKQRYKAGIARDICDEPKVDKVPAFVVASGAALDDAVKYLKDWHGGMVCSTSQARSLMYHGIEPTHIVALDPFSFWDEIGGVDWSKTKTKLVTHPGVWPDLIDKWPNDILLYLQNDGRPNSFYAGTQKRMYTWREPEDPRQRRPVFHFMIRTSFTLFACSPPMQMFVADFLGYGPIFLAGLNWCKYGLKRRMTEYSIDDGGKWVAHENLYTSSPTTLISNNGLLTQPTFLYYKKNVISAWRLSLMTLYDVDRPTILTEVPHANIEKIVRRQGYRFPKQSHQMIMRITERYLASVGAYVVNTKNGQAFIESQNPEEELLHWMTAANRLWECPKCGAQATANDDKDYTGEECLGCHEKAMVRKVDVDIEANMRRIRSLIALTKARQAT